MSTYYTPPADIIAGVKARSAKINEVIQSVEDGFDALPPDLGAIVSGSGVLISGNDSGIGYLEDKLLVGDAITFTKGNPGGDENLTISIEDAAITNAKIQTDAVTTIKIQDAAVTTDKIPSVAVTYEKIQHITEADRLLGRSTIGTGIIEEIPLTSAGRALIDDINADAQRVTLSAAQLGVNADITSMTGLDDGGIPGSKVADIRENKNIIINGGFTINQRLYSTSGVLATTVYAHDRWKAGASGGDYSFTQLASPIVITIASGKSLIQVIEDRNVVGGTYTLSWEGAAQGRYAINSDTPVGSYASSPIAITGQTAGTTMSVEFNTGTLGKVKLESGTAATDFDISLAAMEFQECQRYYEKSYLLLSPPGALNPNGSKSFTSRKADQLDYVSSSLSVIKVTSPVIVIYNWLTGATGQINDNVNSSSLAVAVTNISQLGFTLYPIANTIADHHYGYHYTAEAEL